MSTSQHWPLQSRKYAAQRRTTAPPITRRSSDGVEHGRRQAGGQRHLRANRALAAAFRTNAESIGRVFLDPASVPIEAAGSTDMGNVSHVLPVIHPVLDVGTRCAGHTIEMTAAAITPAADRCMLDAAKAMAATVIDYWTQPGLRDRIAVEWAAQGRSA